MSISRTISIFIFAGSVLMMSMSANAGGFKFTPEICKKMGLGKNWYCGEVGAEKGAKQGAAIEILESGIEPEDKAELLNQLWETQRKRAVITGKRRDIENVLETQSIIAKKGVEFAKNAQKITDSDPRYSVGESNYKVDTEDAIKDAEQAQELDAGRDRYVLVMIYNKECPSCQRQLPELLKFCNKWQYKNLGVAVTEEFFGGLDSSIFDDSVVADKAIESIPTLLLLDSVTEDKIFLSKGITRVGEMESKMAKIIKERG
jgi:conjugal transfer pilus assembly protein TraF